MEKKIDPYIRKLYGIGKNTKYEILEVQPIQLLMFSRLDIIAKVIYLEKKSFFSKKLYEEHIQIMTILQNRKLINNNQHNIYESNLT